MPTPIGPQLTAAVRRVRPRSAPTPPRRTPLLFFLVVFALAVPFWVLGAEWDIQLLPGLPIAALMFVCPALAAVILSWREHGAAGVSAQLKRALDYGRIRSAVWLAPILLLKPALAAAAWGIMRLQGTPVPVPHFEILPALALIVVFFIAALGEELGWSGYALDPLQGRWDALRASLVLGAAWAVFHYVALVQAHRSAEWIAWWSLGTVAARVVMVWLYNNTGKSVFAAALFHMMTNVTWQLFPVNGSYFDPRVTGLILALVAVIIVVVWRPQTLVQPRSTTHSVIDGETSQPT
jgi:membrane protease YdiL (CAAX protease family)